MGQEATFIEPLWFIPAYLQVVLLFLGVAAIPAVRRKLNERAPEVRFMHTVRGIGFRLADDLLRLAANDLASSRLLDAHSLQSRIA